MTKQDLSEWRGIGIGWLMLLCYGSVFAMMLLAPPEWDRWDRREVFVLGLLLLYGAWALARRPLRWLVDRWAEDRRERHEGLKNVAVTVMCLVSAALCVAAFPIAWRYGW